MRLNKLTRKLFAAGLALSLVLANAGLSFGAEAFSYDPVVGGTSTLTKNLEMDANANVPNVTFDFEIEPGEAIPAAEGSMEVLAGVGTPTIASITFTPNDSTAAKEDDTTVKVATKTTDIDFTGCEFDEPGIYRYTVTETGGSAAGITYDDTVLTLDVYVVDDGTGVLEVASYVLHTGTDAPVAGDENGSADVDADGDPLDDKVEGFTNEYTTYDLEFSKAVSGNQASRDKYFQFTVTISGAVAETVYTVDISNAEAAPEGNSATVYEEMENPNELTADANGGVEQTFYLQHGQSIVIQGLAEGTAYEITEEAEDYLADVPENAASDGIEQDETVAFTNTRDGVIPTGVILDSAPFILIIALAAAALVLSAMRKRSR